MFWRTLRVIFWIFAWIIALGCAAWASGALRYDFPLGKTVVSWTFIAALLAGMFFLRGAARKISAVFIGFALVLAWWLTLKPSNEGQWLPDVAETAWAEVNGDEVTF